MAILTRKEILEAVDLKTQEVEVPEWGGSVLVRSLTGAEREQFELAHVSINGTETTLIMEGMREQLVTLAVVDETGKQVFTAEDINALSKKSASALDKVFAVAQELSALRRVDVEALAKNSVSAPTGASTSI